MLLDSPSVVGRVLLTADTVGGVWTHALELARGLGARGVAVELATMGAPLSDAQRAAAASLAGVTVHESAYRLEWMSDPWDDLRAAGDWLLGLAARTAPDVVHLNQYAFGALAWDQPVLVAGHSCVLSWWEAVHGTTAPPAWRRYRAAVGAGLAGAGLVVAPSRAMMRALQRHYRLPLARRVIANGRDPRRFQANPKHDVVLGLGRVWDEAKNMDVLARAASAVPWPVRIAGATRSPDGREWVAPGTVAALGALDEDALAAELASAAIVALPASYEPFGLAALEAALSGGVLVLGDIESQRELWDGAAAFVAPRDPAALAGAIRGLAAAPARRARLARESRRRALALGTERMTREYLNAYAALCRLAYQPSARETTACAS
jgi:glycosyltransferase involved in cell wall biosynthesis